MSKKSKEIPQRRDWSGLKQADPDRYRAALLAAADTRERLLHLYAFHYELAKIPEWVSEPMVGEIRYQWWRECIDEIYTDRPVRAHEVSTPLAEVLRASDVPRFWMDQLIDGRARDLDPTPFTSLDECVDYCDKTSGVLMRVAVKLCAPNLDIDSGIDAAISATGRAWGLTGLLRGYRYYHDSMLSQVSFETLLGHLPEVIANMKPKSKAVKFPTDIMPALAYGGLVRGFHKRLSRTDYDPTQDAPSYGGFRKHMAISKSALKGRF